MKFSFGSGERLTPGFVHCDHRELPGIDIVHDWQPNNPLPLQDGQVDEVFLALDVLEHFDRHNQEPLLADISRVCSVGCELIICVPDLERTARVLLAAQDDSMKLGIIEFLYGRQDYPSNYHRWGFTRSTLITSLGRHKFSCHRISDAELHFGNMIAHATRCV